MWCKRHVGDCRVSVVSKRYGSSGFKTKSCPETYYSRHTGKISTRWTLPNEKKLVLHSIRLDQNFQNSNETLPLAIPLLQPQSITWVRLIQSHWLLVASSNAVSSPIALWSTDVLLSGTSKAPFAEAFLSAPVGNGAIDVNRSSVTIALELCGRLVSLDRYLYSPNTD